MVTSSHGRRNIKFKGSEERLCSRNSQTSVAGTVKESLEDSKKVLNNIFFLSILLH